MGGFYESLGGQRKRFINKNKKCGSLPVFANIQYAYFQLNASVSLMSSRRIGVQFVLDELKTRVVLY